MTIRVARMAPFLVAKFSDGWKSFRPRWLSVKDFKKMRQWKVHAGQKNVKIAVLRMLLMARPTLPSS
jgi:hypothetical protein